MRFQRKRKRPEAAANVDKQQQQQEETDPSMVIDLTGDSSDEDDKKQGILAAVGSTRKRLALLIDDSSDDDDDTDDTTESSRLTYDSTRVKAETKPLALLKKGDDDDDDDNDDDSEVEIVNDEALQAVPTTINGNSSDSDDEIAIVGTKNHVDLVHMRQHCVEFPFRTGSNHGNSRFCTGCFCYVCDVKAVECPSWVEHCHATDADATWKHKRAVAKAAAQGLPARPSPTTGGTFATTMQAFAASLANHARRRGVPTARRSLPAAVPRRIWEQPTPRTTPQLESWTHGPGPFPPTTKARHDLIQCRYCRWYSKLTGQAFKYYGPFRQILAPVCFLQWCLHCGRVASHTARISKSPSTTLLPAWKPTQADIFLGTEQIPFTLHVHDPRNMTAFCKAWEENNHWNYDPRQMAEDLFSHRITATPDIDDLMDLWSPFRPEEIPTDGCLTKHLQTLKISAVECDALLLNESKHGLLLRKLAELSKSNALKHQISAVWNAETSQGTLTLRTYVPATGLDKVNSADNNLALFLGLWFDVFPCPFAELSRAVKPGKVRKEDLATSDTRWWNPDDNTFSLGKETSRAWNEWSKDNPSQNSVNDASQAQLTLTSSVYGLGGVCPTGNNLETILKNYFSECLPDEFARDGGVAVHRVANTVAGLQSQHRPVRRFGNEFAYNSESFDPESLLGPEEAAMHTIRYKGSEIIKKKVNSLATLLTHCENLGHAEAPFVEGLNVELLPFQRQSLKWAIERETMPGGVQSLHWAKVPLPANATEELYFNPLLGMFSKTKPNCVRGGWICEQMGMGKTIISLSLVLSNVAPALPVSGSRTTALAKAPKPVNGQSFWKPNTTSTIESDDDKNPNRGRYLSRGTLVVCNVSLVGQWIEEAKSKLENPEGKIYAYYGASRKRDAKILAKNAIVVTTYETLVSDATYHAKKAESNSYCPPVEQIRWWRIICDESHVLRTANAKSQAVMRVPADHKWLVSGTPISTNITDITQQLKFLGIGRPSAIVTAFRNSIGSAIGNGPNKMGRRARSRRNREETTDKLYFGKFTWFMRSLMIRHSQNMRYSHSHTTLMSLPSNEETVLKIDFTPQDKQEYLQLEEKARSFYSSFNRKLVSKSYLKVMSGLLPLRIACAGGKIPLDPAPQREDDLDDDAETVDDDATRQPKKSVQLSEYAYKSKLERLIQEMVAIRDEEPDSKMLIFSQFTTTLEWLQEELPKNNFQFRTLSGDMTMAKRAKALRDFDKDPPTTVFVLSMRAGAVGINLTAANRVFLLEPCFNPALEQQAIGRVWRLGQTRPVKIYRMIMKGSVEERMQAMLENKYGGKTDPSNQAVGSLKSDKAAVVASEFDTLFGIDVKPSVAPDAASSMGI